jgi:MFS family permease
MRYIKTDIPKRLDELPWSRFHTTFLLALGITWVLDAFEIVIVGNVLSLMSESLGLSELQSSLMVSGFLIGAIIGSLIFGYLSDRFGRKKIFIVTLLLYSLGTFMTGFAWDFYSAFVLRLIAGAGIGGEFAAIHSAIDEFVPARHRGKVDGFIVASWNIGSLLASFTALILIKSLPGDIAWRSAFFIGGVIALLISLIRRFVPESPRWLLSRGYLKEAEIIVETLEQKAGIKKDAVPMDVPVFDGGIWGGLKEILARYRWRFLFGSSMSFTILTTYYGIITLIPVSIAPHFKLSSEDVSQIFIAGSLGGLLGGIIVAIFADVVGRKVTGISVALLSTIASISLAFSSDFLVAYYFYSFTAFSFASVAYVSAMEIFPSYIRSTAIGFMSVIGRISGTMAPPLLVYLASKSYFLGLLGLTGLWLIGLTSFVLWGIYGVEAGKRSLEDIT